MCIGRLSSRQRPYDAEPSSRVQSVARQYPRPGQPIRREPQTVAKWRSRDTPHAARMGPKNPRSTVLTAAEEAIIVALRQKTLLALVSRHGMPEGHRPQPQRPASLPATQQHLQAARRRSHREAQTLQNSRDRLRPISTAATCAAPRESSSRSSPSTAS